MVQFGLYVVVASANHTCEHGSFIFGASKVSKVIIGKGAWIGSHCSVLSGCKIGAGAVIGANTVVLDDVQVHTLFIGAKGSAKKQYED